MTMRVLQETELLAALCHAPLVAVDAEHHLGDPGQDIVDAKDFTMDGLLVPPNVLYYVVFTLLELT